MMVMYMVHFAEIHQAVHLQFGYFSLSRLDFNITYLLKMLIDFSGLVNDYNYHLQNVSMYLFSESFNSWTGHECVQIHSH